MREKGNVKRRMERDGKTENQKRDLREGSLRGSRQRILLYLYLYQLYYKSLCGRRQVAELPKNMCVVSVCFRSILALFYHPKISNRLRFIVAKVLFAVLLLLHFMFQQRGFESRYIYEGAPTCACTRTDKTTILVIYQAIPLSLAL